MDYNHYRPHSSLGYMSLATFEDSCLGSDSATLCQPQNNYSGCHPLTEACKLFRRQAKVTEVV